MKALFLNKKVRGLITVLLILSLVLAMQPFLMIARASSKLPAVSVQASSTLGGGMGPDQLIDGDKGDMFSSKSDTGCWVYLELDDYYDIESVLLCGRTDKYMLPRVVKFTYSLDGIDWLPIENGTLEMPDVSPEDPTHTEKAEYEFFLTTPVTAKFVRIQTTDSRFDGTSYLTQYAEIEVYGSTATNRPDIDIQSYKIANIGTTESNFYQFEDVGLSAAYPDEAHFIPYYLNPIFGDGLTRAPAAIRYSDRYVVAYEIGEAGGTEIYAKISQEDRVDAFYDAEFKLVAKGSFDSVSSPAFVQVHDKTYLAFEATAGVKTDIYCVEYTGQKNITASAADKVTVSGIASDMYCPSLTYDAAADELRLYFAMKDGDQYGMHVAKTTASAPKAMQHLQGISYFNNGKVFLSAGGYFGIVRSYFDSGDSLTEWISSADGLAFERGSTLVRGNLLLNGTTFATGGGCAVMDADGNIAAVFADTFDAQGSVSVMMALPQMRVMLSKGYVTYPRVMATDSSTQIVLLDRDYSTTDMVRIYRSPYEGTVYELRQNLSVGNSYQIIPIDSNVAVRTEARKIANPSLDGLKQVMPESIAGSAETPTVAPDNLIAYDENTHWQTTATYTYNPAEEELRITMPAVMKIGALALTGYISNGTPNSFRILASADGETFGVIKNQTRMDYPGIQSSETRILRFDEPVEAKVIKIVFDRYAPNVSNMCQLSLSKLAVYAEDPDPAYIYDPATIVRGEAETMDYGNKRLEAVKIDSVRASSELETTNWGQHRLIDGDLGTLWSSQSDSSGSMKEFIELDLGVATDVARVELVPRGDAVCFPKAFRISTSGDGETWTQVEGQVYTNYPVPDASLHQYLTFGAPVNARYVRIDIDKQRSDGFNFMSHLGEVLVYKVVD